MIVQLILIALVITLLIGLSICTDRLLETRQGQREQGNDIVTSL